ncbi:Type 1 glutamine amidotransferase-like domain-containing protein [Microbacterium sp. YY-01]|uniref:Type 1 glutamine amidotransferase-like domain-containing protein n=1 Tax=Microbacterium sp. YY-01 TaxID=3421634 RepID=UPI003D169786
MKTSKRSIVLLGGGFSDNEYPELDQFLLETSGAQRPRVCFIPTASGDSRGYIERFYNGLSDYNCDLAHLELFRRDVSDFDDFLDRMDIIYVGGGNTANMLEIWRLHKLDAALCRAYERGTVLAGISAGAACWFEACLTDSFGPLAVLNDGLGLIPGSFCPHYDSEVDRAATYSDFIRRGLLAPGVGLDDGVAIRYIDETVADVFSAQEGRSAHFVDSPAEQQHQEGTR